MGILNYPDSASASGTGAGTLVYTFVPESGAEYVTPLLADDAVYTITVQSSDPTRTAGLSMEIFTTDLTTPKETVTVFADNPLTYPKPITRIKIVNGSYTSSSNTSTTAGTGKYEVNGISNFSTLSIRKFAKVTPLRTGNDNDTLGDIYVHVEQGADWAASGVLQSGGARYNGEDGYGWNMTRKWVGWSFNYNYTGVYRIGRNNEVGASGPGTNLAQHGSTSNLKTFQYKDFTSQTWTNLTPIPDEVQFYNTNDTGNNPNALTQALIYDTQNIVYVMFRKRWTPIANQTIAGQTGTFNQLLYKYTKATNTWTAIGAYNITTWGDPSHTQGPKMFFIASDQAGNQYLFPWQMERTSNTFFRYNLTTGVRSQATDSTIAWHEGTYVNGYFFVSPTLGIGNTDGSATDYQIYNPSTNSWSNIAPPSRTATNGTVEASTWFRGGTVFKYSATAVGVIGRRTYTSNNTTPANNDRYWGRRFFIYDFSQPAISAWIDKSSDLGNFYPSIMRPASSNYDRFVYQPQVDDWNGRFLLMNYNESGFRSKGNYEYVNTKKPKQVTLLGQTGRHRGEMSVGSYSVLAFGNLGGVEVQPRVYQTPSTGIDFGGETWGTERSWGMEIVYVDGTVKYGPMNYAPQNTVYNPLRNVWYTTGWEYVRSQFVSTSSGDQWARVSYVVDEKNGTWQRVWTDFYGTAANRGWQDTHSAGLAYNDVTHFYRTFDTDAWYTSNLVGGYNSEGSLYRNLAFTNYTWHPNQPGTNTQRTTQSLSMASDQRTNQVVAWGKGPRNIYGIPEGTLFWDGSTLRMYSHRDVQAPFSASLAARDWTDTVGQQTGWRIIYTTPSVGARTTYTWYGCPKVWRDENWAICQNSTMETYYVFDLNNLYTREPKIIQSHTPIEAMETPSNTVSQSATIGNNGSRWIKNAANVGGIEIVYGHADYTGYRHWYNDNIYIVRDYPTPSALTLDKNAS